MNAFDRARRYVYLHARPLDLARWRYSFEGGSPRDVLTALAAYRNPDGGFAHALEADCWNPLSSPIQTWAATEILRELGFPDEARPMIDGIVQYLKSGDGGDADGWKFAVPSNNDYPHAPWWTSAGDEKSGPNPTFALAGFLARFSGDTYLAEKSRRACLETESEGGSDAIRCHLRLWEYAYPSDGALFDRASKRAANCILSDLPNWGAGYVCMPMDLIEGPADPFYPPAADAAKRACDYLVKTHLPDGSWDIPWQWNAYESEWAIAKVWWKSHVIVRNIRYLRAFGRV